LCNFSFFQTNSLRTEKYIHFTKMSKQMNIFTGQARQKLSILLKCPLFIYGDMLVNVNICFWFTVLNHWYIFCSPLLSLRNIYTLKSIYSILVIYIVSLRSAISFNTVVNIIIDTILNLHLNNFIISLISYSTIIMRIK
jgi:hypothetical protein